MSRILEAVPNVSEGRDAAVVSRLAGVVRDAPGVELLDVSSDPDHHRSVLTFIGPPAAVEDAAVALARAVVELVDLRGHRGVHPRVGALDVLPFVPLEGLGMADAVASARRVGARLGELGIPVAYYAHASDPPGRGLAELRRGGIEALGDGFPADRLPDEPRPAPARPHPSAGLTCVGARDVLLAWNVDLEGVPIGEARALAARIRERGGGFPGLRALGLALPEQDRVQISMNLEDPRRTSPMDVFRAIESRARELGGRIRGTEVIGMIPDALVHQAAGDRLVLPDLDPSRILARRVAEHMRRRVLRDAERLRSALDEAGDAVPEAVRQAALRLIGEPRVPSPDDHR